MAPLYGLGVRNPTDVWAVGAGGTITHGTGTSWSPLANGSLSNFCAVHGTGANDIWAAGNDGTVLHFDGSRWAEANVGTTRVLSSVFAVSPSEVWAVEGVDAVDSKAWHRKDGQWSEVQSGSGRAQGVWASGPNDAWIVGARGAVSHWDGNSITRDVAGSALSTGDLNGVWGVGSEVWAVGDKGTVLHRVGSTWSKEVSGTSNDLFAISGDNANLWASGLGVLINRPAGTSTWTAVSSSQGNVRRAVAASADGGFWYATDEGVIVQGSAAGVSGFSSGTDDPIKGIWSGPDGQAVAVGSNGILLRHKP